MDLNKVTIIWRSTTDLELKKMEQSWNSVVNFTIATNRKYKNKDWNSVEEAEFHRCVAFWVSADLLSKYLEKGKRVYIEWRLRTRKWEDSNGTQKYTTEIIVENFIFLDNKNDESIDNNSHNSDEEIPF